MLNLIDYESFKDPVSGWEIASYVYLLFWVLFIIVGEGVGKIDQQLKDYIGYFMIGDLQGRDW